MLIQLDNTTEIDTDRDLNPEERHVLQKLLCYKTIVESVEEFRQKKEKAYLIGWNNSGPIRESKALQKIVQHMEKELALHLQNENNR